MMRPQSPAFTQHNEDQYEYSQAPYAHFFLRPETQLLTSDQLRALRRSLGNTLLNHRTQGKWNKHVRLRSNNTVVMYIHYVRKAQRCRGFRMFQQRPHGFSGFLPASESMTDQRLEILNIVIHRYKLLNVNVYINISIYGGILPSCPLVFA